MIKPVTATGKAYDEMTTIEDFLAGKSASRPLFAELFGGADMKFASIQVPSRDSMSQKDKTSKASQSARLRGVLLAALKRDAIYSYATRGALFRQAWQREILNSYEHGRALELTETA